MKHRIVVDQRLMESTGLTLNRYVLLDLILNASSWADTVVTDDGVFWWTARSMLADEVRVICPMKPDTVYRALCDLTSEGFIEYTKDNVRDLTRPTDKAKSLFRTMSDDHPSTMSDADPNQLGSPSESGSDADPTYPTTKPYPSTIDPPLKKNSPALRMRIKQDPSPEYAEFLSLMAKSPRHKDRCASMWYVDRGGYSYQTIWTDTIKPAILERIQFCDDWGSDPKYHPKPDDCLEERKWENKILPRKGGTPQQQQHCQLVQRVCRVCNDAPPETEYVQVCRTCREAEEIANFNRKEAERLARKLN